MAEAYSDFAAVYDQLMDNIPYDDWFKYLQELLTEYNIMIKYVHIHIKLEV